MSNGWSAIPKVNFEERMDDWAPKDVAGFRHVRLEDLNMERVAKRMDEFNGVKPVYEDIGKRIARVDGLRAEIPYGGTPVIGAGFRLFPKTERIVADENAKDAKVRPMAPDLQRDYLEREAKIEKYVSKFVDLHAKVEPDKTDLKAHALWEAEKHQVLTGGGYDGGKVGDVTNDFLLFFERTWQPCALDDHDIEVVVEAAKALKTRLIQLGVTFGSAEPTPFEAVRLEQNRDGLIGWPIYGHAFDALTEDNVDAIKAYFGVDCTWMLSSQVCSSYADTPHEAKLVDALSFAVSGPSKLHASDYPNVMTMLKRVQRHGYTLEGGKLKPKKGKIRSIKCPDAMTTVIEGCIFNAIQNTLRDHPDNMYNSLLAPDVRRPMLRELVARWYEEGFVAQSLDWSKWDASVEASVYVTIMDIVFGDFFKPEYRSQFEFAMRNHVYKYCAFRRDLVTRGDSAKILRQLRQKKAVIDLSAELILVGGAGGMGSGLKGTYVGNSTYGLVMQKVLNKLAYGDDVPFGSQTGDDTVAAQRVERVNFDSSEESLGPLRDCAAKFKLVLNVDKLVWVPTPRGLMVVYLQEYTAPELDIEGVGSIFRYGPALLFGEYPLEGGLLVHCQAELSKLENGANNPFFQDVAEVALESDRVFAAILQTEGEAALATLIARTGAEATQHALFSEGKQFRLDVDSFLQGRAKCLPALVTVAKERVEVPQKAVEMAIEALSSGSDLAFNTEENDDSVQWLDDKDE